MRKRKKNRTNTINKRGKSKVNNRKNSDLSREENLEEKKEIVSGLEDTFLHNQNNQSETEASTSYNQSETEVSISEENDGEVVAYPSKGKEKEHFSNDSSSNTNNVLFNPEDKDKEDSHLEMDEQQGVKLDRIRERRGSFIDLIDNESKPKENDSYYSEQEKTDVTPSNDRKIPWGMTIFVVLMILIAFSVFYFLFKSKTSDEEEQL